MEGTEGNGHSAAAETGKSLFRIGEVSRLTSTKAFVLRYWETEFPMLQPVKSPKGHRLYRRQDIDTVFIIKRLLYDEGFTIAGARRHLRDQETSPGGANGGTKSLTAKEAEWQSEQPREQPHATQTVSQPIASLNRKTLLDLRDSLRSLLTALESE